MGAPLFKSTFQVKDYDLDATLDSGQAFRWTREGGKWVGVIAGRWVSLGMANDGLIVRTTSEPGDWHWLRDYLQLDVEYDEIVESFPDDEAIQGAVKACRGLRLLRQEPWECLASFICSSSKQIVQIRQIVKNLCDRFGEHIAVPDESSDGRAFPTARRLARCSEGELRECKMGYRAPYVLGAAKVVTDGGVDLNALNDLPCAEARRELMKLPGVGRKVADCVLLFAYGFEEAFPIDVWIGRGLNQLYFPKREPNRKQLEQFTSTYFGPHAGYAQQYLFHYVRTVLEKPVRGRALAKKK